MGVTGSGKSTFINRVTGGDVKVGHDLTSCKRIHLYDDCPPLVMLLGTSEIEIFDFQYQDNTVHIIDTPGFDDTYRTDSDVLKDIVFWLNAAYRSRVKLSGIIYLHPIDRTRMTGSAYKNIRMFGKLCGDTNLQTVVLATTMWKHVDEADGNRRQQQLKETSNFWGGMVDKGSCVFRHDDSRASAMKIISYILDQRKMTILQVQRQMVDEGKTLNETSAGQELEKELSKQRELFERRLQEAREDMKEAVAERSRQAIEEANAQHARFQKKLEESLKESEELKVSMQHLLEQKVAEQRQAFTELELARYKSEEESRLATEKLEDMRRQVLARTRSDDADVQHQRHLHEMEQLSLRSVESQISFQEWRLKQLPPPKNSHEHLNALATGTLTAVGTGIGTALVNNAGNCTVM